MNGRLSKNVWVLTAGAFALAVGACSSDSPVSKLIPKAGWSYGENPKIEVVEKSENEYHVDFGAVAIGATATLAIVVENVGSAPLIISRFQNIDGFSVDFSSSLTVGITDKRTIQVSFSPTEVKSYAGSGVLSVADASTESLTLSLKGEGREPGFSCDTTKLDFGRVVKGRTAKMTVTCLNESEVEGVLIVSAISGDKPNLFSHKIAAPGRLVVGPGVSSPIEVMYDAAELGLASARLEILREGSDDEPSVVANISLLGFGIDHAIECGPRELNFGHVDPRLAKHLDITCLNHASEPSKITSIALEGVEDNRFVWEPTAPIDVPAFTADNPGEAKIDVAFVPALADIGNRKSGLLVLTPEGETSSPIEIKLTGFAGGPVITCTPEQHHFGQVAKGVPATKMFLCHNSGTDDPNSDDDALVIDGFESSNPEFSAAIRDVTSLPARFGVNEPFSIDVTYLPVDDTSDNNDQIKILSNDTVHPAENPYSLTVAGTGLDLPPCDFDIVPPEMRFGIVSPGRISTQEFAIRNNSSVNVCLIRDMRLENCDEEFSLVGGVGGEVEFATLPAGDELRFGVEFAPTKYRSTPFTCEVHFDISHPEPHQVVPIRGASQEPCALISPNDLDFGTVPLGCSSSNRSFSIINICESNIVYDRLELGGSASDEFHIKSYPTPNYQIKPGASVAFEVAYAPKDEGRDRGSVLVYVRAAGVTDAGEPYMVDLSGRGNSDAEQIDTFKQIDRPKIDILWVIDNSGSMAGAQSKLASNLKPFIEYAEAQKADFQIGVTTTGLTSTTHSGCMGGVGGGESGRLFPVDGATRNPPHPRIITNSTSNIEAVWAENFKVGVCHTDERPLEAAVRALTPPVINNSDDPLHSELFDGNLGFLRSDAHLSIIIVTDADDFSVMPVNYYLSYLRDIKGSRNTHLLNVHAIASPSPSGCKGGGFETEGASSRVEAVVEATSGIFESICTEDWSVPLSKMSTGIFGFLTCFPLGNVPANQGEIVVTINGHVVSAKNAGRTVWSYNASEQAVCFGSLDVPEASSEVAVRYPVACLAP